MSSYVFKHGSQRSNGQPWGLGMVLRDAEGSTGQTSSSDNWNSISQVILHSETSHTESSFPKQSSAQKR